MLLYAAAARDRRRGRARLPLPRHGGRRDGHRGADLRHLADRAARRLRRRAATRPTALQWVGIAFALCRDRARLPRARGGRSAADAWRPGVGLALVAALGFGLFVVGLGEAAQESAPWAIATARLSSVTALVLALAWTRTVPRVSATAAPARARRRRRSTPGANALIAIATTHGSIGIVAVLSALYPIMTILLARAVLHERLGPTRTAGGLVALGGAALIAAG